MKPWKPNGLSKHLKDKVSSYMDNIKVLLHSRLNLGFNLNYFSFLLQIFVHLELFFLQCIFLFLFYPRINKLNVSKNFIGISSLQNGL